MKLHSVVGLMLQGSGIGLALARWQGQYPWPTIVFIWALGIIVWWVPAWQIQRRKNLADLEARILFAQKIGKDPFPRKIWNGNANNE